MLKITGDGRKAALDMRLVDPFAEVQKDTKVSARNRQYLSGLGSWP